MKVDANVHVNIQQNNVPSVLVLFYDVVSRSVLFGHSVGMTDGRTRANRELVRSCLAVCSHCRVIG